VPVVDVSSVEDSVPADVQDFSIFYDANVSYPDDGRLIMKQGITGPNALTYSPFKAAMIRFTGSVGGNPVLVGTAFNATVAKGAGTGIYRITLDQPTIYGVDIIGDQFYPIITLGMDSLIDSFVWSFTDGDAVGGWFEITVYEQVVNGQNLNRIPADMGPNDDMWVSGSLNYISPDSDPIPA
jgi:hypothetical protein